MIHLDMYEDYKKLTFFSIPVEIHKNVNI